jgi:hypothetical protein
MRWLACLLLTACTTLPPGVQTVTSTHGQPLLAAANGWLYGSDLSGLWRAQPTPGVQREVILSNGELVQDLTADLDHLYYTSAPLDVPLATVRRIAHDGSGVADIASNVQPGSLRADLTDLFWLDRGGSVPKIMRAPKVGGMPAKVVVASMTSPSELAVDNAFVFFVDGNTIQRAPKAGGPAAAFQTDVTPTQLGSDGVNLYFVDATADITPLYAVDPTGARTEIVHSAGQYWLDGPYIYYTAYTGKKTATGQSLQRIDHDTGVLENLVAALNTLSVVQMVFDDTHLYWADGSSVLRLAMPGTDDSAQ